MSEQSPIADLTDTALVNLIRNTVASAGLCGFDSLDQPRQLLAEAATRIARAQLAGHDDLIEVAENAYSSWAGGEPIDREMREIGRLLGMISDPA